jgi:hypothetical protein
MSDLDVVAGIVEQGARLRLFVGEMRRYQRKIARVQPPQQVVAGPFAAIGHVFACEHPGFPRSAVVTIAAQGGLLCVQVHRQNKTAM